MKNPRISMYGALTKMCKSSTINAPIRQWPMSEFWPKNIFPTIQIAAPPMRIMTRNSGVKIDDIFLKN